jgi:predicted RNA-binding Zn-ribbon protein involved in translation (DUF1610 family)
MPESETSITYCTPCNIPLNPHRPTLNYRKPQSGKFVIDPKRGYWAAVPSELYAHPYRLRIDEYGDIVCPNCGLIYNNDDYDRYFVKPIATESIKVQTGNDINYSDDKEPYHDLDPFYDHCPQIYLVPDFYLWNKKLKRWTLRKNQLVYVYPGNNQAKLLVTVKPKKRKPKVKRIRWTKKHINKMHEKLQNEYRLRDMPIIETPEERPLRWIVITKDLHRELSKLGYLPEYDGNKTMVRKDRGSNLEAKPKDNPITLEYARELIEKLRYERSASAATV